MLTCTTRLGESQTTRRPKRLTQPNISVVNIYECSSIFSAKDMDQYEVSSAALENPSENGNNQVGESAKVSNYRSWHYLTEFL